MPDAKSGNGLAGGFARIRQSPVAARAVKALWPYALLALLVVIFFWDSFFAHQAHCLRHTFCDMLSSSQFFQRNLPTDEWVPLWNPFNGYGKPFLAEPVAAFFYPLNWLYVLFEPGRAFTIYCALHFLIAGFGLYALCRHWKLAIGPSLLAAISFMFSTWVVAMIEHRELFSAVVWGPLDLLLMSWLLAQIENSQLRLRKIFQFLWQRLGWIAGFALLVAVQYLAGYPQMLLYNLLLVSGFAVGRALWLRNFGMLGLSLSALMLAGLLALCLCLPQFLLSLELTRLSERSHGIDPGLDMASMHPRHLITLLLPFVYGRPGYPEEYWAETLYEFWVGTCYVGILPLMLSTFSMLRIKGDASNGSNLKRFLFCYFVTTALVGLVLAAGKYTPIYMFLYQHVPGFGYFRWPAKLLLLPTYSLAILAGLGLQGILEVQKSRILTALKFGWLAVFILFLAGFLLPRQSVDFFRWLTHGQFVFTPTHYREALGDYLTGAVFLGLGVLALWVVFRPRFPSRWAVIAVVGVAFVNLFIISRQINFRTQDDIFATVPDLVTRNFCKAQPYQLYSPYNHQFLYGNRDRSAFIWAKNAGLHSTLEPYRIFHVFQDGLKLERWKILYATLHRLPPREQTQLANLMNIRYAVGGDSLENILWRNAPKTVNFTERTNCLPRAYVVRNWDVMSNSTQVLETIISESFDIRQKAIIEPLEAAPTPLPAASEVAGAAKAGTETNGTVSSIRHTWNRVELEVNATTRSLLVLVESWYPGWKALIDGSPQPIFRANFHFRAVSLAPGHHKVVFTYQPWQFRFGLWVSLLTAGLALLLLLIRYRRVLRVKPQNGNAGDAGQKSIAARNKTSEHEHS